MGQIFYIFCFKYTSCLVNWVDFIPAWLLLTSVDFIIKPENYYFLHQRLGIQENNFPTPQQYRKIHLASC